MFTPSLKGNIRNGLSEVKFNGLDRFAFRSMAIIQSTIVICVKDKEGNFAIEGNKGLKLGERSVTQDESYRMDG